MAGVAAKKPRKAAPDQIFAGLDLFAWRLSGVAQVARPLVQLRGGTLTELNEGRKRPLFAPGAVPLVLVEANDTLERLHAFMGGVPYRAVGRPWVRACASWPCRQGARAPKPC
jgi:hypothetical protein